MSDDKLEPSVKLPAPHPAKIAGMVFAILFALSCIWGASSALTVRALTEMTKPEDRFDRLDIDVCARMTGPFGLLLIVPAVYVYERTLGNG